MEVPCLRSSCAQEVEGLSGDEVDPKNIIAGGRGARRGRGGNAPKQFTFAAKKDQDSDQDSW